MLLGGQPLPSGELLFMTGKPADHLAVFYLLASMPFSSRSWSL